jgi:hypothetical protein
MIKHPIADTKDGIAVYVDLIKSPASVNISQQPHIVTLIKELLKSVAVAGGSVTLEVDFGRNIGNTDIVETTEKDHIVYAKRIKHDAFTRFVRRRTPKPTSFVTITLHKDTDGDYELFDAWIGRSVPPMPGGKDEAADSKDFWAHHALIIEGQSIQTRTLTLTCPY